MVVAGLCVSGVSIVYHRILPANATTASLTYLLMVLAAATLWGLPEAVFASVWSMLCLDYYFLAPVGMGIDDPQNWVAWCVYLVTALVASNLSTRLRKKAEEATDRKLEIERLYALSRSLMFGDSGAALSQEIPSHVTQLFGCAGVAFFDLASGQVYRRGLTGAIPEEALRQIAGTDQAAFKGGSQAAVVPVNLGGTAIGSIGFQPPSISKTTMQAVANLTAIAVDRARKQEAAGRADAARRHQELKSTLLDALAHDFQTPVTSIRASVSAMLAEPRGADLREWLEILNEESTRLGFMMAEAIQMARIEAGHLDLDLQTHTVEDLVLSALGGDVGEPSQVIVDLQAGLPQVSADAGMIRLVIRQLAGNALKYSAGSRITVRAEAAGGCVVVSVTDRGPGIPAKEQERIFEEYFRGSQGRGSLAGTGMGLPIARQVIEAHHGCIWVDSRPGEGAKFSFTLPFAHEEASV